MAADSVTVQPSDGVTVLYRGPLERSRLGFLLRSAVAAYGEVSLLWLVPPGVDLASRDRRESFERFVATTRISGYHIVDGRLSAAASAVRQARRLVADPSAPLICVGFSTLPYGRAVSRGPLVWCVNGIPEERLLHRQRSVDRAIVEMSWRLLAPGRPPDLVVTVSASMKELIRKRYGRLNVFVAPNTVDLETFQPPVERPRPVLAYLGTGAPWQGMEPLSRLWGALARLRPDTRFRVISRDARTRVLAREVPEQSIECVAAEDPAEVAGLLWDCQIGFIIRAPHIANRVAYPTKFGEYVGAGVAVVASDVGWDVTGVIRDTGCGLVLETGADAASAAPRVAEFMDLAEKPETRDQCRAAAELLDLDAWVKQLAGALPS